MRAAVEAPSIDWVMLAEGVSFRHAVELLAPKIVFP